MAARNGCTVHIKSLFRGWCLNENAGFYNSGIFNEDYKLLGRDEIHLSKKGKEIFGNRLEAEGFGGRGSN